MSAEGAVIAVRRLGRDDAASFRLLRLEALRDTPEAFGSTYESEAADPPERFADRLADGEVFGAFRGTALIGMIGLALKTWPKSRHKAGIWGMYVQPGARGTGVGAALLEAAIAAAAGRVEILQLKVVSSNTAAQRLYDVHGFTVYGLERRALKQDGRYYDELLMARDL